MNSPEAREGVRRVIDHSYSDEVQAALIHSVSLWRDGAAVPLLIKRLKWKNPQVRRVAAEALGRIGDNSAVPAILAALADEQNDRVLDHSLTYALMEIGDRDSTAKGLAHDSPRVRRAALAALESMTAGRLEAKSVIAQLNAKDATLRETAWWIAGRHPDWGTYLVDYFREQLRTIEKMTAPEKDELAARCALFQKAEPIRKVVGDRLAGLTDPPSQRSLLRALARSGLKSFPNEWKEGVLLALFSRDDDTVRDAISVLRAVPTTEAESAYIVAKVEGFRGRISAPLAKELLYSLHAAAPPGTRLPANLVSEVISDIHRDRLSVVRAAAADLLTRTTLPAEALIILAKVLETANPVEVGKILPAFAKSTDEKIGRSLIEALSAPALRNVVRTEAIKPILDKYPQSVRDDAEKLYALLAEVRKGEIGKLEKLLKEMPAGEIRRGQLVFNGAKGQCVACHKIGYVGGTVGPDLTRVGGIRSERDLLESIVFPSASFVRSYEPVKVVTADGRSLNGILKKDAPDEIVIVVAADKEERVARADIEQITPSALSIMPAGFEQQLSTQEIADLIAFLKACR